MSDVVLSADLNGGPSGVDEPLSREMRTPVTIAGTVVSAVCDAYDRVFGDFHRSEGQDPEKYFIENAFKAAWDDETTCGDRTASDFFELCEEDEENAYGFALLHVSDIAMAYAVQAMKAEKNSALAWSYAADASYWMGILLGTPFGKGAKPNAAAELAKMRHAENYALAEDVRRYWRAHIDPSLSAQRAAEQVIRANVVPLSHKKIAEIISRLRKEEAVRTA